MRPTSKLDRYRDKTAQVLCNLLLKYMATPWYSTRIGNYIERGMVISHTEVIGEIQAEAWDEGWDKSREVQGQACPDDYNPYRKGN